MPAWRVGLAVFVYLAGWALIRPPLQSPDEPQHLMKANSVWLQPWLNAVPDRFVPDRAPRQPARVGDAGDPRQAVLPAAERPGAGRGGPPAGDAVAAAAGPAAGAVPARGRDLPAGLLLERARAVRADHPRRRPERVGRDVRLPAGHVRAGRGAVGAGLDRMPARRDPGRRGRHAARVRPADADARLHLLGDQPGCGERRAVRAGHRRGVGGAHARHRRDRSARPPCWPRRSPSRPACSSRRCWRWSPSGSAPSAWSIAGARPSSRASPRGSPAPRWRSSTPGSRCASWPRGRRTTRSASTSSSAGSCSPTCGACTGASSDGSTTAPRPAGTC